jgi:SAM-dependent methyltransferase
MSGFVDLYDAMIFDPRTVEIYGGSDFFNVGWWDADTREQPAACRALMARLLDRVPAEARLVLDVGCGLGAGTQAMRERLPAAAVLGINLSPRQLGHCRERAPGGWFAAMDAARLGLADGCFDAVVSVEAAFHFHSREAFLREAARVLRPGGRLVLSDILLADARLLGEWMVPPENRVATLEGYALALAASGFADIRLEDATAPCWIAFCEARSAALARQPGPDAAAQAAYFRDLARDGVRHYVLASATRPVSPASSP